MAKKTKLYFTKQNYKGWSISLGEFGKFDVSQENSIEVPTKHERDIREKYKGGGLQLELPLTGKNRSHEYSEEQKMIQQVLNLNDEGIYRFAEGLHVQMGLSKDQVRKMLPYRLRHIVQEFLTQ